MIVIGKIDLAEIKRCYVDALVGFHCPYCDELINIDFNQQYLNYPVLNSPDEWVLWCNKCDNDVKVIVSLKRADVDIEVVVVR